MGTLDLRVVALDLSLTGTGLAATHDHHDRPGLLCRTVRSPWGAERPHDRLHDILADVAAAVKCKPDLVVIEGASYGSSGNAVDQLAGLRWVVRHWLWSQRIPFTTVAPATVKVWATGSGATSGENKVTKRAVREAITATYGHLVHIGSDDEADAVSMLSLACAAYAQPLARVVDPKQTRAIQAVTWPALSDSVPPGAAVDDRRAARPGVSVP